MLPCENSACRPVRQVGPVTIAAVLPVLLLSALGCGVGEYRSRIASRVEELANASEFGGLYATQPLGDKPVSIRVPQMFERQPLVAGAEIAEEGAVPAEARVQPGLIDLPGLTYTYEEFVADAEGGKIPYYLYLSAEKTSAPGYREPTTRWLNQLKDRLSVEGLAWENVECDTPVGGAVVWRHLRAEGEQPFYYVGKEGEGRVVKLPGIIEIYYRVDGDWAVALTWRVPEIIAEHVNLGKWAPMVAGAAQIQEDSGGDSAP